MAKILIIRFSAIGDVAMAIPVIYSFALQYPEHHITLVSQEKLRPLFDTSPANVEFMGVDLKGDNYKGFFGLNRLYRKLEIQNFDFVADFHDVLRSKYLTFRFRLAGVLVAHISKGRNGKYKLIRRYRKIIENQKSSFCRYEDVLRKLGFSFQTNFVSLYKEGKGDFSLIKNKIGIKKEKKWIGIAPFAKHQGKIYPLVWQEQVIAHFAGDARATVFLFGGGKCEETILEHWTKKYSGVISMAGKLDMNSELILMSYLDVMLSMDSANMHLASLVQVPVVSVWGATHPYAGFMGWKQSLSNVVQLDLPCRPCSVYGKKKCFRGDYACLNRISPQMIIDRIENIIY